MSPAGRVRAIRPAGRVRAVRGAAGAVLRAPFTARTWREYAYVLTGVVVTLPPLVLALLGIVVSALSLFTVGLPLLVGVLVLARWTVRYFRWPARVLLGWDWPAPAPPRVRGPLRRARAVLRDPAGWRALGYALVRLPVVGTAAYVGTILAVVGPLAATYPLWWFVAPDGFGAMDHRGWVGTWTLALQGAAAVLVFPWFLRLFVGLDRLLAYALLGPSRDRTRIAELESGRAALRADAAAVLRRVERDLHDGTQARLVLLGVALSRVERRVAGGDLPPERESEVRALLGDARGTVTEALAELREIIRGIHPPALDDGLEVALATLAARSAVPAELSVRLTGRPPDAVASAVYFTAAELLSNVARHAGATRVRVELGEEDRWLRLSVTDDGRGGAGVCPGNGSSGTGLAGLAGRAAALDGWLEISSPAGGPTRVTVRLPREA